jgi:hypothetical protein
MDITQAITIAEEGYNDAERPVEAARFAKMLHLLQEMDESQAEERGPIDPKDWGCSLKEWE